ncbi:hypothetical protein ACDA63_19885 [Uliginosibacterium sp. sgz301328]|uniref:hypothetical protein n=1 Tax=Uliginosibacterium sp. sgz301328 TaxID=3243764 RepID=UPI00359D7C9F
MPSNQSPPGSNEQAKEPDDVDSALLEEGSSVTATPDAQERSDAERSGTERSEVEQVQADQDDADEGDVERSGAIPSRQPG